MEYFFGKTFYVKVAFDFNIYLLNKRRTKDPRLPRSYCLQLWWHFSLTKVNLKHLFKFRRLYIVDLRANKNDPSKIIKIWCPAVIYVISRGIITPERRFRYSGAFIRNFEEILVLVYPVLTWNKRIPAGVGERQLPAKDTKSLPSTLTIGCQVIFGSLMVTSTCFSVCFKKNILKNIKICYQ